MDNYYNIKNLLRKTQDLPETQSSNTQSFDQFYPQYSQFLKNTRDEVIKDKLPDYLSSPSGQQSLTYGQSEQSPISPLLNPELRQNLNKELEFQKLSEEMKKDPTQNFDRHSINEKIAKTYVKDTHPEMIQNIKMLTSLPKINNDSSITADQLRNFFKNMDQQTLEKNELKKYQQKIAQELTGIPSKDAPLIDVDPNSAYWGEYFPQTNQIVVQDPTGFSTPVHEYLHKKERDTNTDSSGNEKLPNLLKTEDLADAIVKGNSYHLNEKLNEQQSLPNINSDIYPSIIKAPPGESAFYFNKLRELMKLREK